MLIGEYMKKSSRVSGLFPYPIFVSEEFELLNVFKQTITKIPVADPGCFIGIEVEVEKTAPLEGLRLWNVTKDGSLRNDGYEFVSKPIRGRLIECALLELKNALYKYTPYHEFTDRTSVHIHTNVRHMEIEHVANFVLLYLALEPIFFKFTEKLYNTKRRENNYCVPIEESKSHLNLLHHLGMYYATLDSQWMRAIVNNWRKYTAFNLLPMESLGTIEFRHMGGTIDVPYIMDWINMILSMRKYARQTKTEDIKKELFMLNTNSNYANFLHNVLGIELEVPFNSLMDLLEDSVASTKQVFAAKDSMKATQLSINDVMNSPFVKTATACGISISYSDSDGKYQKQLDRLTLAIQDQQELIDDFLEGIEGGLDVDQQTQLEEFELTLSRYKKEWAHISHLVELSKRDASSQDIKRKVEAFFSV
jgi:hypothetical protein